MSHENRQDDIIEKLLKLFHFLPHMSADSPHDASLGVLLPLGEGISEVEEVSGR